MYSSTLGRFLQRDPEGYAGGTSLYEFVNGSPISRVDPFGLDGELPQGVAAPTGAVVTGPVVNTIDDLIRRERAAIANDPNLDAKLRALKQKEQAYSCVITVKSITYLRSDDVVEHYIVDAPQPGGGASHTLYRVKYVQDEFEIHATLKCNCPIQQGDVKYVTTAVRAKETKEIGPSRPPVPKPKVTPIPGPGNIDVAVPTGISGGSVGPGGFTPAP